MNFLKVLTFVVVLFGINETKSHHRHQDHGQNNSKHNRDINQDEKLSKLNESVVQLIGLQQKNQSDGFSYAWDLINPCARFILLNQTQIINQLPFDIENKLKENKTNLNWCSLPENVKSFLLNQKLPILMSLSYEQWGWSNNLFSNATLYSLLSTDNQMILPVLSNIIAPVQYDMKIDLNELKKQTMSSTDKLSDSSLLTRYFDSFIRFYLNDWFSSDENKRDDEEQKQQKLHHHKRSAKHFFAHIRTRAKKFVKSVGLLD